MSTSLLRQILDDARQLRISPSSPGGPAAVGKALTQDGFKALVLHRVRDRLRRFHVPLGNHLLRRMTTVLYGMEIGNEVSLGEGVSFVHTLGIILGGDSQIGARVRFMGNNTVGTAKENGYPIIEDDVLVGAGARILGPVRVGRGAVIGANAVVVRDVPPGAVVTGVPGVIRLGATPGNGADAPIQS